MNNPEALLDIGDWILAAGFLPAAYFALGYGFSAPWRRSLLGVMFVLVGSALALTDAVVLASLFFGADYPGRWLVRILGYSVATVASYVLAISWVIERRSAEPIIFPSPLRRKDYLKMPDATPGPDHAAPSPSWLDRSRKAIVAGASAGLAIATPLVGQALTDGAVTADEVAGVVSAFFGAAIVAGAATWAVRNERSSKDARR
jgi:HAMP domain-containing protein